MNLSDCFLEFLALILLRSICLLHCFLPQCRQTRQVWRRGRAYHTRTPNSTSATIQCRSSYIDVFLRLFHIRLAFIRIARALARLVLAASARRCFIRLQRKWQHQCILLVVALAASPASSRARPRSKAVAIEIQVEIEVANSAAPRLVLFAQVSYVTRYM
jgi:hypothetical protein